MIFKVEAQGDTVYVRGKNFKEAERKFKDAFGPIPKKYLTWTEVNELPEGEEFIGE